MPARLADHPMFRSWTDPLTSVTSYVLTEQIAPVQMSLPSVTPSVSADERWLWFIARHPPSPTPTLGVVALDPNHQFIRHFPQAGFTGTAPLIAPEGDAVYFCAGPTVYRLSVRGHFSEVCSLPAVFLGGRELRRLATHLTLSADGRYLLFDGVIGTTCFVAIGDLASGQVNIVKEFQAHHGCAQFSPVDPETLLIAQLPYTNPYTGHRIHEDLRPHLMDIHGHNYHCVAPHVPCADGIGVAFEWFFANGDIAYVDFESGVWVTDVQCQHHEHIWNEALCHADADRSARWWCADRNPAWWDEHPMAVLFYDAQRQRTVAIDSGMPPPVFPRSQVNVAPFPRFSPKDTWVVYTTTRRGGVDVALSETNDLRDAVAKMPALEATPEREVDVPLIQPPPQLREAQTADSGLFNPPI